MCTRSSVAAPDDLLRDGLQVVGQRDDVVAVPAHAAADVQQRSPAGSSSTEEILSAMPSVG